MTGDEKILKKIYRELIIIRERLEAIEYAIIPEEELSSEEMAEIKRLKEEALRGEAIPWENIKKD